MSIDSDFDADTLITLLAGPLPPHLVAAFRRATEGSYWNEGAVYRAVVTLQRQFFNPRRQAGRDAAKKGAKG